MKYRKLPAKNWLAIACCLPVAITLVLGGCFTSVSAQTQSKQEKKKPVEPVKRVKRPVFDDSDSKGIYFDNIFRDGFVGSPPDPSSSTDKVAGGVANSSTGSPNSSSAGNWSRLISREAIEDEVKLIHRKLQPLIRSPSGFNSKLADARQQFSTLSMLFGVIHEYDKEVRWKKYAIAAQQSFAEVAEKSRTASRPTFELARRRTEDLSELIRGGVIEIPEDVATKIVWPQVTSRRALMIQLEDLLQEVLKPSVSQAKELDDRRDEALRQANIAAAIAKILSQDGMDEADDDGYVAFAKTMETAATDLTDAIKNGEFDQASAAVNRIEQSCTDCHSEWR